MKIAIVGTGNVARSNYLPFLSKQEDVDLVYFSRTKSKADACASDFGGKVVESTEEILSEDPDATLVLTMETQRYEAAVSILAGRPRRLFFEKPLVAGNGQANVCEDDFINAKDLLERSKNRGTETAMVFNYRFFDQTVRMQKIVADRGFGELIHASLFVNYACWSHCLDLLHLFGGRADRISGLAGDIEYQNAVDVSGAFRLLNGATGTILGTSGTNFDFPLYQAVFNFERGTIRFNDLDGPIEVFDKATRHSETYGLIGNHSRWDQYRASFEKSLAAYLDSIRRNAPPPVPGIAGLEELQFEVALRRSIAQRRPVNVQEEFPIDI